MHTLSVCKSCAIVHESSDFDKLSINMLCLLLYVLCLHCIVYENDDGAVSYDYGNDAVIQWFCRDITFHMTSAHQ